VGIACPTWDKKPNDSSASHPCKILSHRGQKFVTLVRVTSPQNPVPRGTKKRKVGARHVYAEFCPTATNDLHLLIRWVLSVQTADAGAGTGSARRCGKCLRTHR
jgi:hypothetical protein